MHKVKAVGVTFLKIRISRKANVTATDAKYCTILSEVRLHEKFLKNKKNYITIPCEKVRLRNISNIAPDSVSDHLTSSAGQPSFISFFHPPLQKLLYASFFYHVVYPFKKLPVQILAPSCYAIINNCNKKKNVIVRK